MDNLPLDNEAEDLIKNRLAKNDIRFAKPNFDRLGLDILAIEFIDRNHFRHVTIQSKGRNVTTAPSNVSIPINYVNDNFVCFLYLKVIGDAKDYLFCFFENDIKQWNVNGKEYVLYIPKKFNDKKLFQDAEFNNDKVNLIKSLLSRSISKPRELIFENKFSPIETSIDMWRLTGGLPDFKITSWFMDNLDFSTTLISHDLYLLYLGILHGDAMQSSVDNLFYPLTTYANCDTPIFNDLEVINSEEPYSTIGTWFITYNRCACLSLTIKLGGQEVKALYSKLGDSEEFVETLLIEDGNYMIYHNRY